MITIQNGMHAIHRAYHCMHMYLAIIYAYAPSINFYQYLVMKVTAADIVDFPQVLRMSNIEMKYCASKADRNTLVCFRQ